VSSTFNHLHWKASILNYSSNRYGMTYTTLRYSQRIVSELFKFELYILHRTLKWNKVCQTWKSKIAKTDLNKINLFVIQNFRKFFRGNDFESMKIKKTFLLHTFRLLYNLITHFYVFTVLAIAQLDYAFLAVKRSLLKLYFHRVIICISYYYAKQRYFLFTLLLTKLTLMN